MKTHEKYSQFNGLNTFTSMVDVCTEMMLIVCSIARIQNNNEKRPKQNSELDLNWNKQKKEKE